MDRPIHAPATEQRRIRRVHNRVHHLPRDVPFDNRDPFRRHRALPVVSYTERGGKAEKAEKAE
jgi:hypothetical protein